MTATQATAFRAAAGQTPHSALSTRARPPRPSALSASLTFGWRALLKIKHVPEQLIDVIGIPILFTVLFTYLFGGALSGSTGDYLQSLLPGTLAMTLVLVSVYTGVGLNTDITKGLFDRFRSVPIWQPAPIFGALLGDVFRYSLAATMVITLGVIMGFRPAAGVVGVVLAVALIIVFAISVSWMWIIVGMLVKSPESVMTSSFLLLFPLTMASNIFVDPRTMPGWLQKAVALNPVTHLANASRGLMHGNAAMSNVVWVLVASAAITAVFAPLAMRMYHRER